MKAIRSIKSIIAAFALCVSGFSAQAEEYSTGQVDALSTCQRNNTCTRAQRDQIEQYKQQGAQEFCNGRTCTRAELNALANTQAQSVTNPNDPAYQSGLAAGSGTGTVVNPTSVTNTAASGVGTASSSGGNGQIIMLASAGAAVASATVLKTPCMNAFSSAWACPLMALAIGQIASSLGGAGKAGSSKDNFRDLGNVVGGGAGAGGAGAGGAGDPAALGLDQSGAGGGNGGLGDKNQSSLLGSQIDSLSQAADKLANDLKKSGYTVSADGKTVTYPNGKKVSTSTFGSPAAMSAAGFSDSQISDMQNALDQANKAADAKFKSIASLTNDVGGGGGGAGSSGGGGGDTASGGDYGGGGAFKDPFGKNGKGRAGAGVAGMSKKLGDDNIGVAGDDIFQMITRRYQARDKADNFIKDP
jgi:hypothetical protein